MRREQPVVELTESNQLRDFNHLEQVFGHALAPCRPEFGVVLQTGACAALLGSMMDLGVPVGSRVARGPGTRPGSQR